MKTSDCCCSKRISFIAIGLMTVGMLVMMLTEGGRPVTVVADGQVIKHFHYWDIISLPVLFAGIFLLVRGLAFRKKDKSAASKP